MVSCCCWWAMVCFTSTLLMLCSIAYFLAWKENRGCRGSTTQWGRERRLVPHHSSQNLPVSIPKHHGTAHSSPTPRGPGTQQDVVRGSAGKQHAPGARHSPLPPSHPATAPYLQGPGRGTASFSPLLSESVCTDRCYRREGPPPPHGHPWAGLFPLSTPGLLWICSQNTPALPWLCSLNAPVHLWLCLHTQGSFGVSLGPLQIWQSQRFQPCRHGGSVPRQTSSPHLCSFPGTHTQPPPEHLVSMAVFGSCQGMGGSNPGI